MENFLNDNVVIPEHIKKMSQEELHAEIKRLEEKNGIKTPFTIPARVYNEVDQAKDNIMHIRYDRLERESIHGKNA